MNGFTMRLVHSAGGDVRHAPMPFAPGAAKPRGKKKRIVPDPMKTNGESAAEQLRLLIERAERLDEEIRGLQDDRADVFAEAKSRGYDDKAMKAIMALRKKDKAVVLEDEAILDLYRSQLGML